jgi:circadian clock protein KaiC
VSTCETEDEVREIARAHGWSLDDVSLHYLDARTFLGDEPKQSVFHPIEAELPKTMDALQALIDRVDPQRLVIDSLSEIRLLAADSRWFRRQVLALKEDLAGRQCTTLLCDDRLGPEQPVKSIVHGVIELEQTPSEYGPDRRRVRVEKLRARAYMSGYHDFKIRTGGLVVYPRLVAAEHRRRFTAETFSSGVPQLDALFGGGVDRGTAVLLLGPSGSGKSLVASQYAVASAQRGERAAMYIFDERIQTVLQRAQGVEIDLTAQADRGLVEISQVDPAELSPGEFAHEVCQAVNQRGVRLVVIDSLTGYILAMPNERMLLLHLHELLSYLAQQSVTVLMVVTQHGLPRSAHSPIRYELHCRLRAVVPHVRARGQPAQSDFRLQAS